MSTLTRNTKTNNGMLFRPNPVLNRLNKVEERVETGAATYAGIATKTSYFLLITLVGVVAQLLVKAAFANEPVWQSFTIAKKFEVALSMKETVAVGIALVVGLISELVGIFSRRSIPVAGTIYSASQGYFISFLVFRILVGYEYLGLEALLLTVAVVAVMSWLYSSGIIRPDKKFRTVMLSLMIGSVLLGVLTFLGSLIPATRPYVQTMLQNPWISIGVDVLGLLIAALFLISDFSMIDQCVTQRYPKEYEWSAAFGLVFTVIWIYLKILDLLMKVSGKNKD